jgi:hypothetical protein
MDTFEKLVTKLIDSIPALLIVGGICFLAIGIIGTLKDWFTITTGAPRIAAGLVGFMFVTLGLLIYLRTRPDVPKAKDYEIKIVHPRSGDSVLVTDVRGTVKRALPEGYTLKVFRVYNDEKFFPLRDCRIDNEKGTWEATGCDLGGAKTGDRRAFTVNIVGPNGSAMIEYIRDAMQVHNPVR